MIYSRTYTVSFEVHRPLEMCADKPRAVTSLLQEQYVGRCYQGGLLVGLEEGDRQYSMCRCNGSQGKGVVNVHFRARTSVLGRGDSHVGASVLSARQMVTVSLDAAGATGEEEPPVEPLLAVVNGRGAELLQEGQQVPLRLEEIYYAPFYQLPAGIAQVLTCDAVAPKYRTTQPLTPEEAQELRPLAEQLQRALERRARLRREKAALCDFFERLLYAYTPPGETEEPQAEAAPLRWAVAGAPDWEGPQGIPRPAGAAGETEDLLALVEGAAGGTVDTQGVWQRPLALHRSAPRVVRVGDSESAREPAGSDQSETTDDDAPLPLRSLELFTTFLHQTIDALHAIERLVQVYSEPEVRQQHRNIWGVMRMARRSPPS
jgi:hypothetical protein